MPECQLSIRELVSILSAHSHQTVDGMDMTMSIAGQHLVRAVKIALAGVISILAAKILGLPQGYWAAISAFVVMGSDVDTTVAASRHRLISTSVGAALGAVFVAMFGVHLAWFGLAVAVTVLLCETLGLGQSYRMASVTVAVVMLINNERSPWKNATYRFLEVGLGILVALVMSALPPKARDNHLAG